MESGRSKEIEAINAQMEHSSYSRTTGNFQKATLGYLITNIGAANLNDNQITTIVNQVNSNNSKYKLQFRRYGGDLDAYEIKIIEKR